MTLEAEDRLDDLRFGHAPLPAARPGFDPAGDARALLAPGTPPPAPRPVAGTQLRATRGRDGRLIVRVPADWNGRLVVAGTPSTRSEYANDAIWCDYLLARGYAFACSNKRIPYNVIVAPAPATPDDTAYAIPFEVPGIAMGSAVVRLGALEPRRVAPAEWDDDFADLVRTAKALLSERWRRPERTYAVGLSVGGAQVRTLLEREPDLVDGGVEWASLYWGERNHLLDYLPKFLQHIEAYARSGCADDGAHAAIVRAGFPPDRRQSDPAHPSLWLDHYSAPPFYNDVTTFLFAALLDPDAAPPGSLAARAAYRPSPAVRRAVARIAHAGTIGKPLVGIAGEADMLIPPAHNARPYLDAVVRAGRGALYHQYLVPDATHVDAFVAFGYGLRAALPFAWAAFEQLVAIVERDFEPGGAGTARRVDDPAGIARA